MTDTFSPDIDTSYAADPDPKTAPEEAAPKKQERKRRTAARSPRVKTSPRAVAQKTLDIVGADSSDLQFLARVLGISSEDPVDITVAIIESKKNPLAEALDDLKVIQESEVPNATVYLMGMDKAAHEALVALLKQVDVDGLPSKVPAKPADAALALINPVREAIVDLGRLDDLASLLEK